MIKSFKCKETQKIFYRNPSSKLPYLIQRTAMRKLWMIAAANSINDLRVPPGNRLEKLKDKRQGQHSIRVNDQRRICFKWQKQDAYEIEITDYH
jgi:proteic killer suppression protein